MPNIGWGSNEVGRKYFRLTVIEYRGVDKHGAYLFGCLCDCGNEVTVRGATLRGGISKSCGCLKRELASERRKLATGDKNSQWRGGIAKHPGGYTLIKNRNHPKATHNGYVAEHRLVMEKMIGRYLLPSETVHHKNGIKDDNREENLELWSKDHGYGIRVTDKISQAIETLKQYAPQYLREET